MHTQTGEARKGCARDTKSPPPTSHDTFQQALRPERPDKGRVGEDCSRGGWRAITIYLSVCLFLLVPSPPSAVPFSPQASHACPPPHITLICAANYTLPALSCLSNSKI